MSDSRDDSPWRGSDKRTGEAALIWIAFMIVGLVFIDYGALFMIVGGVVAMCVYNWIEERRNKEGN